MGTYGQALDQASSAPFLAKGPLDLDACMIAGQAILAGQAPSWGDEAAHVTDLSGLCDREVWARRKAAEAERLGEPGIVREPFDPETKVGFALGHASEKILLDAIQFGLADGWSMTRQVALCITLDDAGRLRQATVVDPTDRMIEGHADAVIFGTGPTPVAVIDVKSTVWWNKNEGGRKVWYPAGEPKLGHRVQVATYALALGAKHAGLYELDLGGKGRRVTWFDPEPYRALIERRMVGVLHTTDPAQEEPDVLPNDWTYIKAERNDSGWITGGQSWACGYLNAKGEVKRGYCSHTLCPRHVANTEVKL